MSAVFSWPKIRRGQRVNVVGPSGSGKTELLKTLLRTQQNAIVVDTKRVEDWSNVGEIIGPKDVYRIRGGRFVYRVEEDFLVNPELPERFFRWALRNKNRTIAIDEQLDIPNCPGEKILATQGRASGVGLWVATQRPHGVPLYTLSEANHTFVFRLRIDRDRDRIETLTGAKIDWEALKPEFSFVYISANGDVSHPAKLLLEGQGEPKTSAKA